MSADVPIRGGFGKDAKDIVFGSLGARVIGLVFLPVITRLYSPEDFAVLSVFVAVITIAIPFATLHYTAAIPLAKTDGIALNLFAISMTSTATFAVVLAVGLDLAYAALDVGGAMTGLRPYLYLVPIGLIAVGFWEAMNFWGTRRRAFRKIATGMFVQSLNGGLVKIGLGLWGLGGVGLLVGQIVTQGGGAIYLFRTFFNDMRRHWRLVSGRRMWRSFRAFWRFPVLAMPSLLLNALVMQVPTLYIAAMFDADKTGNFGLAWTTFLIPIRLLAKPMSQVFYAHGSGLGRKDSGAILGLIRRVGWRFLALMVPANVVLYLAAEPVFPLLFGPRWGLAGQVVAILSVFFTVQFVYSCLNQLLNVIGRQDIRLKLEVQNAVLVVACLGWAFYAQLDFLATLRGYSLVMLLHFSVCIIRVLWAFGAREKADSGAAKGRACG